MKAIRIVEPFKIENCDISEPNIGPEDVLIKVRAFGLCGSDLTTYRGQNPMVSYPRIPGHEIAGQIISKGDKVPSEYAAGKLVAISPYTACGKCSACRIGRVNCCKYNQTMGVQRDGSATELICVPYQKVFITDTLTIDQLVCVEPISVGWHAAGRASISPSETVLVFGCGVIGLGVIIAANCRGASVIAVDIDNEKLAKARLLGAEYTLNSIESNFKQRVDEITKGNGPNVVIEAVGLSQTFAMAVDLVGFAGRVIYVGYAKKTVEYETKLFVSKEIQIGGSRNALNNEIESVLKMLERGKVDVNTLITQQYNIADLDEAFAFWDKNPHIVTKIKINVE